MLSVRESPEIGYFRQLKTFKPKINSKFITEAMSNKIRMSCCISNIPSTHLPIHPSTAFAKNFF